MQHHYDNIFYNSFKHLSFRKKAARQGCFFLRESRDENPRVRYRVALSQRSEKEHRGTAISLRGGISEAVANPQRRCRFSVFRSCP